MIKLTRLIKEFFPPKVVTEEEKSAAAQQAEELGLVHKGWGRYADAQTGEIVAMVKSGHLVKINPDAKAPEKSGYYDPTTTDDEHSWNMQVAGDEAGHFNQRGGLGSRNSTSFKAPKRPDDTPADIRAANVKRYANRKADPEWKANLASHDDFDDADLYPGYKPYDGWKSKSAKAAGRAAEEEKRNREFNPYHDGGY